MPKDNPGAYRKIDEFIAGLSSDEQRYLYGAIEAIIEGADSGETAMPENDAEAAVDDMAAPAPMSGEDDDMMAQSGAVKIPKDDDTTDYDKMFNA